MDDLLREFLSKSKRMGRTKAFALFFFRSLVYAALIAVIVWAVIRDWSRSHAWWICILILPVFTLLFLSIMIWFQWRSLDQPHKALYMARWMEGSDSNRDHVYESGPVLRAAVRLLTAINVLVTGPTEFVLEILCARFSILRGRSSHIVFYWLALLVLVNYRLELNNGTALPVVFAVFLIATFVYRSTSHLTIEEGYVRMLRIGAKPIFPSHIMIYALLMACTYGVLYKHLSSVSLHGFDQPLSTSDAIYFSVITLATVGYGDIHPTSPVAKWVCVSEVVLGLMMLVIALNATMTFWLQDAKKEELASWRKDLSERAKAKYETAIERAKAQISDDESKTTGEGS